ncbi:PIN domain-containing protein [Rhodopseudomonas sp. P2A-2r]|uniref:PIN domain-containing protein n=1 Tax=unclassified Rhodopseudomonas TaxID=2638247 RepID=UPI0022342386|nr:PIN domain-containing protein [Rhodopseudomonas sp. P2A-2r]UZE50003.1 PIN domain-containing protein [Rhodopseudomonas sp. P2A-2r]
MRPATALLDANVLFSGHLRNLLLQLAANDVFVVKWSPRIEDEWLRNMPAETRERIVTGTVPIIRELFPDAYVNDFDPERSIGRTDPKDRHVASAAVAVAPSVLVTFNLKDFDVAALEVLGVRVLSPDQFLSEVFESGPAIVDAATREAAANLSRSFPTWDEYLTDLAGRHGLKNFVDCLRSWTSEDIEQPSKPSIPTVK